MFNRDGPWPDPTRAYFWPTVNKRLTRLRPGYFLTQPEEKKIEKFDIFRENFLNSTPNLTQPEPQKIDPTRPRSKIFDWDPSLMFNMSLLLLWSCRQTINATSFYSAMILLFMSKHEWKIKDAKVKTLNEKNILVCGKSYLETSFPFRYLLPWGRRL